jgi:hypothetical protein
LAMRSGLDGRRLSLGRRGAALLLALAVELLLVLLLLLFLAPVLTGKKDAPVPTVFGIDLKGDDAPDAPERDTAEPKAGRAASDAERPAPPEPPKVEPPPVVEQPELPLPFIPMTRRDYAASDIARLRPAPPGPAAESDSEAEGAGASAGDSPLAGGRGPNGEPLYAAEWHTRPTNAQLSGYLSARARGPGWGLIACRTVPGYRVEDCQELGESPRGSGYAGSVRQAAWQFRVRPPRKGGRDLVGAWVSIRIDYRRE